MACDCLGCRIAATITEHSASARPPMEGGTAVVDAREALGALASNAAGIIAAHPEGASRTEALSCLMTCLTHALSTCGVDAEMTLGLPVSDDQPEALH